MKKIWFVRHGESMANAGAATADHRTIPLSALGKEQARAVSLIIPRPELIVASPYLRAQQTAAPLCRLYPDIPVETWDCVHEFVYLSPRTCIGTTSAQRRPRVIAYWRQMNPAYCDGDDAESYEQLLQRITLAHQALKQRREHFIVVFSHAQFMRNFFLTVEHPGLKAREYMQLFRKSTGIRNCQIMPLHI